MKKKMTLVIATAILSIPITSRAADFYWDTNGATSGLGGATGNWNTSTTNWNDATGTGTPVTWGNLNTSSAFFLGTAGTVTVSTTGITANSLSFGVTGYTLAGSATNNLTLAGSGPSINVVSGGTATFSSGVLDGAGGFSKLGTGSLIVNSTSTISGGVTVRAGTLSLGTTSGSLASATSVTVAQGATLQLNNIASNNNNNRLSNIDVTLNGGTLNFVGLQAASGTSESINRIVLGSGASTFSLANSTGSGAQLGTLTLGDASSGISRSVGASLNFVDDANGDIISTNLATSNNIIGGWAVYTGTTAGWLKSVSGSLRQYTSSDTGYTNATDSTTWATTANVDATGARTTAGRTINSLNITGSSAARTITISSGTLVLTSGGLMATGTTGHILTGGSVTAGTTAGAELFVYNNLGFSIDSVISNNSGGAVNVLKSGAGTLSITGSSANSASGTFFVNEGTVSLGKTAGVNSIAGNVSINGGTLQYALNDNQIADGSSVTLNSGTFDLGARAETIGGLNVTGGSLTRGGATLNVSGASSATGGTLTFSSASGSKISFASTLALGGVNFNYSSASASTIDQVVFAGTVSYAATNTAPATFTNASSNAARLSLGASGTRILDIADSSTLSPSIAEVQIAWNLKDSVALTKTGSGTLLLSAANTYSGATTIAGGVLSASILADGGLASSIGGASALASNLVFDGGTLQYTGSSVAINRAFTINANKIATIEVTTNALTMVGTTGATVTNGALVKSGAGTLVLSGSSNYTGGTTVNQGTLGLSTNGTLGAFTGALVVANTNTTAPGTNTILNLATAADLTSGSLSGAISTPSSGTNTATINIASGRTFTVNQTAAGSYAGVIAGSGGFTLGSLSTNTLTLSGNNTYSGGTTVSNGTLSLATTGSIDNSPTIDVQVGATFNVSAVSGYTVVFGQTLKANGTVTGAVKVASGATLQGDGLVSGNTTVLGNLSPGNSPGSLDITGNLTLDNSLSSAVTTMEIAADNTFDEVNVTGTMTYDGTLSIPIAGTHSAGQSFDLFDFADSPVNNFDAVTLSGQYAGTLTYDNFAAKWTSTVIGGLIFTFTNGNGVLSLSAQAVPEPLTAAGVLLLTGRVLGRRSRVSM